MAQHNEFGAQGEDIAIDYLRLKGYVILDRNWRSGHREIDIVARKDDTIVFVEVKSRPHSAQGTGLLAVTPNKQKRMAHAAMAFLIAHEWLDRKVRFDVVEISRSGVLHIPNAFSV